MTEPHDIRICGWNAAMIRFKQRPETIIRAYVSQGRVGPASKLLKYLASLRLTYHIVGDDVLAKVSGSVHHEGIVLVVRGGELPGVSGFLEALRSKTQKPRVLLVLDGVVNPHNLGAIARVAAHFGALGLFVLRENEGASKSRDVLTPSSYRIAAGGAESLLVGHETREGTADLFGGLRSLGFELLGTSSHELPGAVSLYEASFGPHVAFVLGSESTGLSPLVAKNLSAFVSIPGTGNVESLNVACAASAILGECWRRNFSQSPATPHT